MSTGDKKRPGEGDRESDRRYREHTEDFVESGKVGEKAAEAEPGSADEAEEMEQAEEKGRERAREKDPAVKRDYSEGE